ncbi:DNA mismatch repair protein [Agyrium rufum]|nr:DNA mismatch repair protein [Agyrium rufum]
MATTVARPKAILPLSEDIAAQIKSSTTITSLQDVVRGLLENSLDSDADLIEISVDFAQGTCCVEDNGVGIQPAEFLETGGLCKPFPLLHQDQLLARSSGTRITVNDLFGNLPVRVKHRISVSESVSLKQREWNALKRVVCGVLLSRGYPVTVRLKTTEPGQKLSIWGHTNRKELVLGDQERSSFDMKYLQSILAKSIPFPDGTGYSWRAISAKAIGLTIRALLSPEPVASRTCQYIAMGSQYISNDSKLNLLYDEVNKSFVSSSFGVIEPVPQCARQRPCKEKGQSTERSSPLKKRFKDLGKGVDRHPMYFIKIEARNGQPLLFSSQFESDAEEKMMLATVLDTLRSLTNTFLAEYHFRPRVKQIRSAENAAAQTTEPGSRALSRQKASSSIDETCHQSKSPSQKPRILPRVSEGFRDSFGEWSRTKVASRSVVPLKDMPWKPGQITLKESSDQIRSRIAAPIPSEPSQKEQYEVLGTFPGLTILAKRTREDAFENSNTLCRHSRSDYDGYNNEEHKPEESFSWTNPISKQDTIIDSRTGLTASGNRESSNENSTRGEEDSSYFRSKSYERRLTLKSGSLQPAEGSWAETFLQSWQNPIFPCTEEGIRHVSLNEVGSEGVETLPNRHVYSADKEFEQAFEESSKTLTASISREALAMSELISQVDKKFLLVKVPPSAIEPTIDAEQKASCGVLVLIDQHAADERIRIEDLLRNLCLTPSAQTAGIQSTLGFTSAIETAKLTKPITFNIKSQEVSLFRAHAGYFATWGILYNLSYEEQNGGLRAQSSQVHVLTLPSAIAERCRLDPSTLTNLLREEAWRRYNEGVNHDRHEIHEGPPPKDGDWIRWIHDCPKGILNLLNSRSCRSAIMFNDELSRAECLTLLRKLAKCHFPFQCAHGRPSMVPLLDLGTTTMSSAESDVHTCDDSNSSPHDDVGGMGGGFDFAPPMDYEYHYDGLGLGMGMGMSMATGVRKDLNGSMDLEHRHHRLRGDRGVSLGGESFVSAWKAWRMEGKEGT